MKNIHIILFAVLTIIITSCRHTSEPLYIPRSVTQLNTVLAPWQKDNDLLPWKGPHHLDIINSIADIYDTQTEKFIEENPNWLNVDFTKKSIISVRTILFSSNYWQFTKVLGFSIYNGEPDSYMMKGDYLLVIQENYTSYDSAVEDDDESQWRICQIAFITDKIPSDAQIKMNWGLRVSK